MFGKRGAIFLFVAIVLMALSACGNTAPESDNIFVWEFDEHNRPIFDGHTLTIYTDWPAATINPFIHSFMREHPGSVIELRSFGGDSARGEEVLGVALMAGTAPDLIISFDMLDYLNPGANVLFADWLPIMRSDPVFDDNDWNMNILNGFAPDGRLTAFPMSVFYTYVAANAAVPGLADDLSGLDAVFITDVMEMYDRFYSGDMHMMAGFDVLFAVEASMQNFFGLEEGRVDFNNPDFIELINSARRLTSPGQIFGNRWPGRLGSMEDEMNMSHRYMFAVSNNFYFQHFGVFEGEAYFTGPVPIADAGGQIIAQPQHYFLLNAASEQVQHAMAWEFVKFLMNPINWGDHMWMTLSHPTHNALLRHQADAVLPISASSLFAPNWRIINGDPEAFSDTMLRQMDAIGRMPMTDSRYAPNIVMDAVREILEQFHHGHITAEAAANDLQNRITLMLMEMGVMNR